MEEYPSNSQEKRFRETERTEKSEKDISKIVAGSVIRRKKPLGTRLAETFFGGDSRSVAQYVVADVLLPAFKDMIADAVTQGFERMIFGESGSGNRRSGPRPSSNGGYVPYNRYSGSPKIRREETRGSSRRGRNSREIGEIILESRGEADSVLSSMYDLMEKYESVSVADLYELTGIEGDHTDEKWGWYDLRGSDVVRTRNHGYKLVLPNTEPILN